MNYEPVSEMARWPVQPERPPLAWVPFAFAFLRRNLLILLLCFFGMFGIGAAYLVTTTPRYAATTAVLVDSSARSTFKSSRGADYDSSEAQGAMVESQIEVIRSDAVARAVVNQLDLTHNALIANPPLGIFEQIGGFIQYVIYRVTDGLSDTSAVATPGADVSRREAQETRTAENLLSLESVNRVGLSTVIDVTVMTVSPQLSAQIANAIVENYTKLVFASRADMVSQSSTWMEDHLLQLRSQATVADAAVQQYRDKHTILNTDRGQLDQQTLGEVSTALAAQRAKTGEAQARYDRIHSVLTQIAAQGSNPALGALDGANIEALSNPIIVKLRQQYLEEAQKVAEWSVRYGPNHQAVVLLRNDMTQLRRSMLNELSRVEEAYSGELKVDQQAEAALEASYQKAVDRAASSNNDQVALRALQSNADTYSTIYSNFLQRYSTATQDQSLPISDVQVISRAVAPISKATPKGRTVMGLSAVLGLALGFVVAFIRETMNRGLHSAGQVRLATRLDCIGMIPIISARELATIKKRKPTGSNAPMRERSIQSASSVLSHVINAPLSEFSEAIRQLNVSILRLLRRGETKVVGCVSSEAGEGKSTLVCNLAQLIARSGRKVVLLDWDLRKRSLTRALAPNATRGLYDIATGLAEPRDVLFNDPVTGLDFLPAGAPVVSIDDQHASDILGMPGTAKLIQELKGIYDVILVDLPALRAVADAQGVDHLIDALFMVVEWGKTDREIVFEGLDRVSRGSARILGLVLNKVDTKRLPRFAYTSPLTYESQMMAIEG